MLTHTHTPPTHTLLIPGSGGQNSGHHPSFLFFTLSLCPDDSTSEINQEIPLSYTSPVLLHKYRLGFSHDYSSSPAQMFLSHWNLPCTIFFFLFSGVPNGTLSCFCVPFTAWNVSFCLVNFWTSFYFTYFLLFWSGCVTCGNLILWRGIKPGPLAKKCSPVLTTGGPGNP